MKQLLLLILFSSLGAFAYSSEYVHSAPYDSIIPVPDELTAEKIIDKYLEKIGGKKKIKRIKKIFILESVRLERMTLYIEKYKKDSRKYYKVIKSKDVVFEKYLLKKNKAKKWDRLDNYMLTDSALEELKYESAIHIESKYKEYGFQLELIGIAVLDDREAYKIKVTSPTGQIRYDYYRTGNYRKIRTVQPMDTPMGKKNIITEYDSYRTVKGIKYPHTITTDFGDTRIKLRIKKIDPRGRFSIRLRNRFKLTYFYMD